MMRLKEYRAKEPGLRSQPIIHIEYDNSAGERHVREVIAENAGTATNTTASMGVDDAGSLHVFS